MEKEIITIPRTPDTIPNNKFSLGDRVQYQRTNEDIVKGFIDRLSFTAVYIFQTSTGCLVAAHQDRVKEIAND